jgi:phosphoribosylamine--glycine ligase
VGGGGREHALAWKLAQSDKVQQVYVAPGNGGTARDPNLVNLPITDIPALRAWAQAEKIGVTVVGPEGPLAAGIVDEFRAHGLRIFGPTKAAAQLESSKAFSKAFMKRHGIPTAAYETFADPVAAHAYVDRMGAPIVVKADGLAAGKGVVVAMSLAEAHEAIDFMLVDNTLGVSHNAGGARVVIEEFLQGEEASFIVMCDGKNVATMATSQDHKRLRRRRRPQHRRHGRLFARTGGDARGARTRHARNHPADDPRHGKRRHPLHRLPVCRPDDRCAGHPKTLEFNCRMGDPETQPIMMRLKTDLLEVMLAATAGQLDTMELEWDRRPALGVVVAAAGYPMNPRKGDAITGCPRTATTRWCSMPARWRKTACPERWRPRALRDGTGGFGEAGAAAGL